MRSLKNIPDSMRGFAIDAIYVIELNAIRNFSTGHDFSSFIRPFKDVKIEGQRNFGTIVFNLERQNKECVRIFSSWHQNGTSTI